MGNLGLKFSSFCGSTVARIFIGLGPLGLFSPSSAKTLQKAPSPPTTKACAKLVASINQEKWRDAASGLSKCPSLFKSEPSLRLRLEAEIQLEVGHPERAEELLDQLKERFPEDQELIHEPRWNPRLARAILENGIRKPIDRRRRDLIRSALLPKSKQLALIWGVSAVEEFAKIFSCDQKTPHPLAAEITHILLGGLPQISTAHRSLRKLCANAIDVPKEKNPVYSRGFQRFPVIDEDERLQQTIIDSYLTAGQRQASELQGLTTQFLSSYPRSAHVLRVLFLSCTRPGDVDFTKDEHCQKMAKEYPMSAYSTIAAIGLGQSPRFSDPPPGPDITKIAIEEGLALTPFEHRALHQLKVAKDSGVTIAAAWVAHRIQLSRSRLKAEALRAWARTLSQARSPLLSFRFGQELINRGSSQVFSSDFLESFFPYEQSEIITPTATAKGLPPSLVFSLIKQESGFDTQILSSVGAVGAMQIMPTTAISERPNIDLSTLLNANVNIEMGIGYLSKLVARYQGQWAPAIAAYNAGPNRVDRWLKKRPKTVHAFIESIPFRETREYVLAIMRNYAFYEFRMTGKFPRDWASFFESAAVPVSAIDSGDSDNTAKNDEGTNSESNDTESNPSGD